MPIYAKNKKALFDYEILEKFEAGIVLQGHEVKSIRTGGAKLSGSYITIHDDEAFIINLHIPKYRFAGSLEGYEPDKSRKLLLKKKELGYLKGKSAEKGLTIVPLSVYTKGRTIKVEIGVARGKKKYDKREQIKKRDVDRQIARSLKEQQ